MSLSWKCRLNGERRTIKKEEKWCTASFRNYTENSWAPKTPTRVRNPLHIFLCCPTALWRCSNGLKWQH